LNHVNEEAFRGGTGLLEVENLMAMQSSTTASRVSGIAGNQQQSTQIVDNKPF
jgi:hypothetical protein